MSNGYNDGRNGLSGPSNGDWTRWQHGHSARQDSLRIQQDTQRQMYEPLGAARGNEYPPTSLTWEEFEVVMTVVGKPFKWLFFGYIYTCLTIILAAVIAVTVLVFLACFVCRGLLAVQHLRGRLIRRLDEPLLAVDAFAGRALRFMIDKPIAGLIDMMRNRLR